MLRTGIRYHAKTFGAILIVPVSNRRVLVVQIPQQQQPPQVSKAETGTYRYGKYGTSDIQLSLGTTSIDNPLTPFNQIILLKFL